MSSNPARRMRRASHQPEGLMRNNGLMLPGPQAPQQVGVQVASPLNDVQLVALVAAQLAGRLDAATPEQAVDLAHEIVARAAALQARLPAMIQELKAKQSAPPGEVP